ncbi:MAG: hypothetical protein O2895_06115, partial [Chloroflexi bacterium]|nr:hypothetical protein [Chloroflexota bacterium]
MLSYLGYGVLWVWVRVFGRLPLRVLYALADAVGGLAWYASPRLRRVTLGHVERVRRSSAALEAGALDPTAGSRGAGSRAAGNRAAGSNARAARGCVRSAARYWADMARAAHLPATAVLDRIESIEGVEHFFEALDAGCGVVLVSAHLGNPEALSRAIGTLGLDVLVLTEPLSPPRLHALLHEVRQAAGARFVPADRAGV